MTALFHDVKAQNQDLRQRLASHRLPGANFDEVLYADDTVGEPSPGPDR